MSISSCRCFALLLLTVPLTSPGSPADTNTPPHPQSSSSTAPPPTYDQIVRLSLVEGDVRIARGKEGEPATGGDWGQATTGIPIETGFSLVTGKGRAEIELEDASTFYLGENSVLTFNELTATAGVPRTDVTLVSGTATLNVRPVFPGESFILRTPTGNISFRYPDNNFIRVNSYLDGMALTPQEDATIHQGATTQRTVKGQTTTYSHDGHIMTESTSTSNEFAEWDEWTAKRIAARDLAMSSTMKEAGLATPIPGLAEMKNRDLLRLCTLRYLLAAKQRLGTARRSIRAAQDATIAGSVTNDFVALHSVRKGAPGRRSNSNRANRIRRPVPLLPKSGTPPDRKGPRDRQGNSPPRRI